MSSGRSSVLVGPSVPAGGLFWLVVSSGGFPPDLGVLISPILTSIFLGFIRWAVTLHVVLAL